MNISTRRNFLRKSTLVALGAFAVSGGVALAENEHEASLRAADGELSSILRSYGRTLAMSQEGTRKVRTESGMRKLPVVRLKVRVSDREKLYRSFEQLADLGDRLSVEGNAMSLVRKGHCFVIENQVV